jgi:serine/threonine protein kinase
MSRATIHAVRPEDVVRSGAGAPGTILGGKYRLEAAIARGGMARVWRATHTTLNRPVAVKFVDSFGITEEERIQRFLKEAKVAASVRHKNVVDIIDFGTSREGEPYMVMELLEGETLDARLARGPMSADEAIDVTLQILSGLDAVHRAGIVHRDLKPGNVFLTDDNDGIFARLLDFGISQGADEGNYSEERIVVGTPEYMSPEQAFGEPLDARSDLYAVGVLLYEMLSGTLPFEDADPQKVVELVAHGTAAPLARLRPDILNVSLVVDCAMSKEAPQRYASAREMRRALLDGIGAPEHTGRHVSAIPRDSRVSGLQSRASVTATTMSEGELGDPGLFLGANSLAAPVLEAESRVSRGSARTPLLALAVLLALVAAATAGAMLGRDREPRVSAPTPEAVPQRAAAPEPVAAPAAVYVIEPAPVDRASAAGSEPDAMVEARPVDSAAPEDNGAEPNGARDSSRSERRRSRSGGAPAAEAAPTPAQEEPSRRPGEIVRDLDF